MKINQKIALMLMFGISAVNSLKSQVTGTGTSNFVSKWSTTTSITNSQIYDNGTNVGIGTTSPLSLWHVQNGTVLFSGTTGSVPITTAGTYFMWVPEKAALRIGELVTPSKWALANIGQESFAGGLDSWAESDNSFAFGEGCRVMRDPMSLHNHSSVALGTSCIASGTSSIALGENSLSSGGSGSIAIGLSSTATGTASVAIGNTASSTGPNSVALGSSSSSGNNSYAIGTSAYSSAQGSIAIGTESTTQADGDFSIAIGDGAENNGYERSIIFNDDDDFGSSTLLNTTNNQFMARYQGGFIFHTLYTPSTESSFQLNSGAVGIGTNDFQEKLNLNGNISIKSESAILLANRKTKKIYLDTFSYSSCEEAVGNDLLIKSGSIDVNCDSDNDIYGGHLLLHGGDALQPVSEYNTRSYGGDVFIRGGLATGETPINGNVGIGYTLNEYVNISSRVGIGTGGSASYLLRLSLDQAAKPSTNTWTISSDARLKKDISEFTDGLEVINGIRPVKYMYNGLAGTPTNKENIGIIAQEIKKVAPYTVGTFKAKLNESDAEETELLDFNSHALTFVLINAVQELDERTKDLKQDAPQSKLAYTTSEYEQKINDLEKQLKELQTKFENICNLPCLSGNTNEGANPTLLDLDNEKAKLFQNIPNPTSGRTIIPYFVPQNTSSSEIRISDASGKLISVHTLIFKGKGELAVTLNESQGIYYYTLFVDDKPVETKSLLLVNN